MPSPSAKPKPPLKLFISYPHVEDKLRLRFVVHLAQLVNDGLIEQWNDRDITGGAEWVGAIDENLNAAHIIVLLVSPDFLASKYCQEVEVTRALERHDRHEARVIPVILRPCDWKTSRFAKLQAYPTDGTPIVDWRTQDHGFLNAVGGLRRVVDEIRGTAKVVRLGRVEIAVPKPRFAVWAIAAALLAVIFLYWSVYVAALKQGESWLDVGRFDLADPHLRRAAALNPLSFTAAADVSALDVNKSRNDPAEFDRSLTLVLEKAPHNPFLRMLRGDEFYSAGRLGPAKEEYRQAVKLRPSLSDGFWRLGIVYGLQGDHETAIQMLQKALDRSPESPQYQDNLAGEYFRTGKLAEAATRYEGIAERGSPIAAIEAASVHRLLGDLLTAGHDGLRALELLKSNLLPEYQVPWRVDRDMEHFNLDTADEKRCYAEAEYSATIWLEGKAPEAEQFLRSARAKCGSRWGQIGATLRWQLGNVADRQPRLVSALQDYVALLGR